VRSKIAADRSDTYLERRLYAAARVTAKNLTDDELQRAMGIHIARGRALFDELAVRRARLRR
jgi:hypothetical protein